jgi:N-acetylglucosamine kinase-like BadF-type ATPase
MQKYYLAVDGGGTKTDVVCANENGDVVGRGLAGPTNLTSTSVGAASFNLIEAIRQAVETLPEVNRVNFPIMVMGLAGIDSQKEYEVAYEVFNRSTAHYKIDKFILVNDSVIALKNGSDKANAVILVAGTGSICYGQNSKGESKKTSGMDYLLADQGSGYDIGRHVLREAVKSYDGRSPKSLLEAYLCEHFKIKSILELKNSVYHPPLTKIEVAELSPLCTKAFEQNDAVAKDIFNWSVAGIVLMAETVIDGLELTNFDLVFSGAVMNIPYINTEVSKILKEKYRGVSIVNPNSDPVFGAVKMVLEEKN